PARGRSSDEEPTIGLPGRGRRGGGGRQAQLTLTREETVHPPSTGRPAFEIREVSAVPNRDQRGLGKRLRYRTGDRWRNEVLLPNNDERRDSEAAQLGQQVVSG